MGAASGLAQPGEVAAPARTQADPPGRFPTLGGFHQRKQGPRCFVLRQLAPYIDHEQPDAEGLPSHRQASRVKLSGRSSREDPVLPYNEIKPHPCEEKARPSVRNMVVTDGFQFRNWATGERVIPAPPEAMPTLYNYARPRFRTRSFDPGTNYSMHWGGGGAPDGAPDQRGTPLHPQEHHRINELWNPAYKGQGGNDGPTPGKGNFGTG